MQEKTDDLHTIERFKSGDEHAFEKGRLNAKTLSALSKLVFAEQLSMAAAVPVTVPRRGLLKSKLRERLGYENIRILTNSRLLRPEYFYAFVIELAQGAAADASCLYSVDLLAA